MRTTLNLDDDVLLAVKELAELRGATAGEVLSDLARRALTAGRAGAGGRNGVPILDPVEGVGIVTPEVVDRLRDED
ncbi:MAG: CopG family transcriptional regulator [Gemmatimonadetes bacterium]|nr:CopG family transcriptional regulator [Gemmatimonadota bacterium]